VYAIVLESKISFDLSRRPKRVTDPAIELLLSLAVINFVKHVVEHMREERGVWGKGGVGRGTGVRGVRGVEAFFIEYQEN